MIWFCIWSAVLFIGATAWGVFRLAAQADDKIEEFRKHESK